MIWQDVVVFLLSLIFLSSLLPMVKQKTDAPLWTALPTSLGLAALAFVYLTLSLFISAALTLGQATLWGIVAIRKVRRSYVASG